jgi:hypothetical protein
VTLPDSDAAVAAWVKQRLWALDNEPTYRKWRERALGMPRPVALASAPREYRLDFRVPVSEMRLLNDVAKARELGTRTYVKRALATVMVACDGVDPAMIRSLSGPGLIGPR